MTSRSDIIKVFLIRRPPATSARWACHPRLLLVVSSSRTSSCVAVAVSGSAAPSPPAGPPAPPSTMTQPPPGGAQPLRACPPPAGLPLTAEREARRAEVETGSVCREFWAARTRMIRRGSVSSSDSDRATPGCSPDEGSQTR